MEPRLLALESDGAAGTGITVNQTTRREARDRRSVSAELFSQQMRKELVETPVRNEYETLQAQVKTLPRNDLSMGTAGVEQHGDDGFADEEDDTLIIHHASNENLQQHTPTGYVSFDPALDPMTPAPITKHGSHGAEDRGMRTCPPKQTQQGLDQGQGQGQDDAMKRRLAALKDDTTGKGRRTTMAAGAFDWGKSYTPKVRSPLAR